jgi:ParB family chromosome partitioning protein
MGNKKPTAAQQIEVSKIDMGPRLRAISPPHAQMMAASIEEQGLRQPIEIRPVKNGRFSVVSGGHRFHAVAVILKRPTISAFVKNLNETEARIAEIDENLVRHELNPLDRAVFLAERKALHEKLHPTAKRGGDRRSAAVRDQTDIVSVGFATEVADKIGLTARTIRRSVAIATGLTQETRQAIAGTTFCNKQSDLITLSKLSASEQKRVISGLLDGVPEWPSIRQAIEAVKGRTKKPRTQFDSALATVLRLPPRQQMQLIEIVAGGLGLRKRAAE